MNEKLDLLFNKVELLYKENSEGLLFHGWPHIKFVYEKTIEFSESNIECDKFIVASTALVHDLNYIVRINSEPEIAENLRGEILSSLNYSNSEIANIESIINEAHTSNRNADISNEAMVLSDADTLYKALPITPVLFTSKYLAQNKINISTLADKIVTEQKDLLESGLYFYSDAAKKYIKWAETNLSLWKNIQESLSDESVKELIK